MDHCVIQRSLTQHPLFICALDVEHRNKLYDVDPFIALDQFRACAKGRQAILTNTPTTLGAKLLVACTALRAYRSGLTAVVNLRCESWDLVARCFDHQGVECLNVRTLCNIIESLTRDNIRPYEEEDLGLDHNQAENDMVLPKCVSSQQSWAVKKPKRTIHAISNVDDVPIFDPDKAARRLCQHWGRRGGRRRREEPSVHAAPASRTAGRCLRLFNLRLPI